MGKVASDKCHKWVFKEPSASECEPNISNYWQSSFDALPPEWTDQFASGIQTIAVIQAGHGLLQLGSCKIIPEDLHFVLRMRHMFESLGYQSGFFLSQLFSSSANRANSPSSSSLKQIPTRPPQIFNWPPQIPPPNLIHPAHQNHPHMNFMHEHHDSELKWPNGLSFFNALTGGLNNENRTMMHTSHSQMNLCDDANNNNDHDNNNNGTEDYMGLDSNSSKARKIDGGGKFKRSYTMPARMDDTSESNSQQGMEYRSSENTGIYSDIMETFLE